MERAYIGWTIENWITVILMVALGYLVVAIVGQAIVGKAASSQRQGTTPSGGVA